MNFSASNIVMVAGLDCEIGNLRQLFECLPIIKLNYKVGTKLIGMERETVPFFGVNDVIIGLKYKCDNRGIERVKGNLPNMIGVDLQCFNKNINLKISNSTIQLTGAKSEEMANDACELLINHFRMNHIHFNLVLSLNPSEKVFIKNWIGSQCVNNDQTIKPVETSLELLQQSDLSNAFKEVITYLLTFSVEYSTYDEYKFKIERLFGFNSQMFIKIPSIASTRVCLGIYIYSIGKTVSLENTSKLLQNVGDEETGNARYAVNYHNWSARKKIKLVIPVKSPQPGLSKVQAHRISISSKGTVRQNSPTGFEEAKYQAEILYQILTSYPTEINFSGNTSSGNTSSGNTSPGNIVEDESISSDLDDLDEDI